MTHQWRQAPTAPQPPPWRQAPPSRPPPTRSDAAKTVMIWLGSLVGLILLAAALLALRDLDYNPGTDVRFSVGIRGPHIGEEPAAAVAAPNYPKPKLSDFKLEVRELRRQKFGPAGANITYYIVTSRGPAYDPDKTYALVYEVRGGQDGPVRNSRHRRSTSGSRSRPCRSRSCRGPRSLLAPVSPTEPTSKWWPLFVTQAGPAGGRSGRLRGSGPPFVLPTWP